MHHLILTLFVGICPLVPVDDPPPLTTDEKQALETITERKVVSIVSFLASDELAGRDTPSPELNIAAAYVASRLRGAGLEPLGPEGSFYQQTDLETFTAPVSGIVFEADGIRSLGMLAGGAKEVRFEGAVPHLSLQEITQRDALDGPVCIDAPKIKSADPRSRGRMTALLSFQAGMLARRGATAVLIVTDPANEALIQAARRAQSAPRPKGRRTPNIPMLLISGKPEACRLVLPPRETRSSPVRNVIAVLRGSDPQLAKEAILFTAHLDHIGRASGPDPVNNGADDDASGVTAVLSLADAYAALRTRPKRSVIFMTFWGEEKGLRGSAHFAQNPLWPLDRIKANINIEMIGRADKPGESWMTGWNHSDLGPLMNRGAQRAGIRVVNKPGLSERLYTASDNISLVRVGIIGHSFSASGLHADYHQPGDEWQKLKIGPMTKVIRGLFAGSLPLAHGDVTPEKRSK